MRYKKKKVTFKKGVSTTRKNFQVGRANTVLLPSPISSLACVPHLSVEAVLDQELLQSPVQLPPHVAYKSDVASPVTVGVREGEVLLVVLTVLEALGPQARVGPQARERPDFE